MNCVICGIRKARRACPGVGSDICTLCCGREREESVDCPLACVYLRDAHEHEHAPDVADEPVPDTGVQVDEDFVERYQWLLLMLGSAVIEAYRRFPAITDFDAREALASLVKTWQTLESGLVYESMPTNPYAASICEAVRDRVAKLEARIGLGRLSGFTVLKVLIFLRRLEVLDNNGRKRSRAFLDMLNRSYIGLPDVEQEPAQPEGPLVIL